MSNLLAQVPMIKCRRIPIPNGDAGIARTIQQMVLFAQGEDGAGNPRVRALATQLTRDLPSRDYTGEINAVFNWVKKNVRFAGEYKETLQSPFVTLQLGTGDCDDHATLLAALLLSLGYQVRFKTIGVDGPDFSHVYLEVKSKGQNQASWISLDTTVPSSYVGWQPPTITREKTWTEMGETRMSGLGDVLGAIVRRRNR